MRRDAGGSAVRRACVHVRDTPRARLSVRAASATPTPAARWRSRTSRRALLARLLAHVRSDLLHCALPCAHRHAAAACATPVRRHCRHIPHLVWRPSADAAGHARAARQRHSDRGGPRHARKRGLLAPRAVRCAARRMPGMHNRADRPEPRAAQMCARGSAHALPGSSRATGAGSWAGVPTAARTTPCWSSCRPCSSLPTPSMRTDSECAPPCVCIMPCAGGGRMHVCVFISLCRGPARTHCGAVHT